jgi:hypothetical protein
LVDEVVASALLGLRTTQAVLVVRRGDLEFSDLVLGAAEASGAVEGGPAVHPVDELPLG